ncbi:hypothetical protein MMC19_006498 [Ptychographa xylographoides]|nr:hypothetical protein [Ptychographa xylographoides]
MPFFKDLRRRSKASFQTEKSTNGSDGSNGTAPTTKSSSTLNSLYDASTPPSSQQPSLSNLAIANSTNGEGTKTPPLRPNPTNSSNNRYSMTGPTSPLSNGSSTPKLPLSPWAPRVLSVSDNSWVHQKVLLIYGQTGDLSQRVFDGTLTITHHQDNFPQTAWPVCDGHFKALVHLSPGPNRLRLDFMSPKLRDSTNTTHSSSILINYLPMVNAPPLQLVVLLGKDSPGTYDAVPERIQREGNGLETAVRKFRMAAYLWQVFTGEQMHRNGFGRRCFRFEEEWQTGSLTYRDRETGTMRNEAKIHIVRTEKTVAELRDLDRAQQYEGAKNNGDLFTIAMDAVKGYFKPLSGQKQYVSVLLLDTHWDKQVKTIRGHAALGGGGGEIQLAIFGSHCLQSYPTSIEEVVPAMSDCTRTDTNFVANDCNAAGSNWEAANIGIGAHLHETGHLLGCPHQESGIMLADAVHFNRTFLTREPYSTRTKEQGMRLVLPKDEIKWHRLDALRFRSHPCFRLQSDTPVNAEDGVIVWPVDQNRILVTAVTGVAFIELYLEGDEPCHTWIEYVNTEIGLGGSPKQVLLTESDLRSRLPDDRKNKKLRLEIHSIGQGKHVVDDISQLTSKKAIIKLPTGQAAFRGSRIGEGRMEGTQPAEVILETVLAAAKQTNILTCVRVYHGFAIDGLEFFYEGAPSQLFGKKGGQAGGSDFFFDTRKGEHLFGFYVRGGLWIDGIQILTSLGRRSVIYGNAIGGSGYTLIPPRGYSIAGVSGSYGPWLDSFALLITR